MNVDYSHVEGSKAKLLELLGNIEYHLEGSTGICKEHLVSLTEARLMAELALVYLDGIQPYQGTPEYAVGWATARVHFRG